MDKKIYREAFGFPAFVLLLIVLAVLIDEVFALPLPAPAALVPLAVGGGRICYDTLRDVWRTRTVTTGILVVLALIGSIFTGEFMEGAEVSFMMLLGEALEDFTMEKTRLTADALLSSLPASSKTGGHASGEGGNVHRLADRFSRYFLPVILGICAVVFIFTRDISRVMSILVIACPCSLVLSSPAAVLSCVINAARRGILLPDGETVERLGAAKSVQPLPEGGLYRTDNGLTLGCSVDADVIFSEKCTTASLSCALALAHKARTIILENIILFACLMNFAGITLSSLGLLPMVPGALLHNAATICVLLNSIRLVRWDPQAQR